MVQAAPAEVVKPDNQLQLSETELKEDIAKMLTTALPDAPKAAVRYIYREHAWRPDVPGPTDAIMMHYSTDGWLIHKTMDEARRTEQARTKAAAAAAAELAARARAAPAEVRPPQNLLGKHDHDHVIPVLLSNNEMHVWRACLTCMRLEVPACTCSQHALYMCIVLAADAVFMALLPISCS